MIFKVSVKFEIILLGVFQKVFVDGFFFPLSLYSVVVFFFLIVL